MLPRCALTQLPTSGSWNVSARDFVVADGCTADVALSPSDASRCMANKTLIFGGDSNIRDLGLSMMSFLSGMRPSEASDSKYHINGSEPISERVWSKARPHVRGAFPAVFQQGYTDPTNGWTIRIVHGSYGQLSWPTWLALTRAYDAATTIVFVNTGIHGTTSTRLRQYWSTPNLAERYLPGGFVLQPLIDHYCTAKRALVGSDGSGAPRPTTPARLVWMTHNEQCARLKAPKYQSQVKPLANANLAAAAVARQLRFPILDWAFLTSGHGRKAQEGLVCDDLATDGVHYKEWVEHVRAQLLASFLCQPTEEPDSATSSPRQPAPHAFLHSEGGAHAAATAAVGRFRADVANCTSCQLPNVWTANEPCSFLKPNNAQHCRNMKPRVDEALIRASGIPLNATPVPTNVTCNVNRGTNGAESGVVQEHLSHERVGFHDV